jgi:hypothetical protein
MLRGIGQRGVESHADYLLAGGVFHAKIDSTIKSAETAIVEMYKCDWTTSLRDALLRQSCEWKSKCRDEQARKPKALHWIESS